MIFVKTLLLLQNWKKCFNLLEAMKLFLAKKAQLYKSLGLKNKNLQEADYKKYLLEHYTFLSRPVFIINGKIYIGNSQPSIHAVTQVLK